MASRQNLPKSLRIPQSTQRGTFSNVIRESSLNFTQPRSTESQHARAVSHHRRMPTSLFTPGITQHELEVDNYRGHAMDDSLLSVDSGSFDPPPPPPIATGSPQPKRSPQTRRSPPQRRSPQTRRSPQSRRSPQTRRSPPTRRSPQTRRSPSTGRSRDDEAAMQQVVALLQNLYYRSNSPPPTPTSRRALSFMPPMPLSGPSDGKPPASVPSTNTLGMVLTDVAHEDIPNVILNLTTVFPTALLDTLLARGDACPIDASHVILNCNSTNQSIQMVLEKILKYVSSVTDLASHQAQETRITQALQNHQSPFIKTLPPSTYLNEADLNTMVRRIFADVTQSLSVASISDNLLLDVVNADFPSQQVQPALDHVYKMLIEYVTSQLKPILATRPTREDALIDATEPYQAKMQELLNVRNHNLDACRSQYTGATLLAEIALVESTYDMADKGIKAQIQLHVQTSFSFLLAEYEKQTEVHKQLTKYLEKLTLQRTVARHLLTHFDEVLKMISSIVQYYFKQHRALTETWNRLDHGITIPSTGRTYSQPVSNGIFIGIYHNIRVYYLCPTLDDFCLRIRRLMDYTNNGTFEDGILFAEKEREEWKRDNMWELFMHPDLFFSLVPIMSWPRETDRRKWLNRLLPIFQKLEPGELAKYTIHKEGPFFRELRIVAKEQRETDTTSRVNHNHDNQQRKSAGGKGKFQNNSRNQSGKAHGSQTTAQAYSVADTVEPEACIAHQPTTASTEPKILLYGTGTSVDQAVKYQDNYMIQLKNGNKVRYIAYYQPCSTCHPSDPSQAKSESPHIPPCPKTLCTQCGFIGHPVQHCLQIPDAYKAALTAKNKANNKQKKPPQEKK